MRRLLIFLIVLAGLFGALELLAKAYVDAKLRRELQQTLPASSRVEAHVSFPVLLDLLTESSVERVQITIHDLDAGPFNAEEVNVLMHRVEFDRSKSLEEQTPVISEIDSLDASVQITQEELSRILPSGFRFVLERDRVTISTPVGSIGGRFEKTSSGGFRFVSQQALPRALRVPGWEFGEVALVDCFDRIQIVPQKILVSCTVEDPDPDIIASRGGQ